MNRHRGRKHRYRCERWIDITLLSLRYFLSDDQIPSHLVYLVQKIRRKSLLDLPI